MTTPRRLMNRDFVLLWQGQFVSQLGTQAFVVAMIFWIKRQTDSATMIGLAVMVSTLPAVLLGPIGGTFADRYSRRTIIIAADFLRGAASLALGAVVFLVPERSGLILPCLFATVLLNGATGTFFRPALNAAIPDLVPEKRLTSANSLSRISLDVSTLLGQGVGGVLFRLLGPAFLFLANGLTFVFSGLSECFIRIPQQIPEKSAGWRQAFAEFKRETVTGLRYTWQGKGLRRILFLMPIENFLSTGIAVLFPFYVEDVLAVRPDWYGYLMAGFGGGSAVGALLAGATNLRGKRRSFAFLALSVLAPGTIAALGLASSPWVALGLLFLAGAINGFNLIHILSLLQLSTPSHLRARVLGLFETLSISMTPLAAGVTGIVADLLDRNIRAMFLGCGAGLLLVALALLSSRDVRAFLAYEKPEEAEA